MSKNLFSPDGLYARAMNWLWNILVLSVLWVVCSLPVFTIGAASTAAYYAAAKSIRHKTGRLHCEFFRSFRSNFRQSLLLSLTMLLLIAVLLAECVYLYANPDVPAGVLYLFVGMLLSMCAMSCYLWACLSRYSLSSLRLLRMSLVLTFRHLLTTLGLLALAGICLLGIYWMPWAILLLPGLVMLAATYPMERILRKYAPAVSEDDPEAQKWYYQ